MNGLFEEEAKLPYPLLEVEGRDGVLEYVIPEGKKENVLKKMYPFRDCPSLDDERIDLHVDKRFIVRQFKVIREGEMNYLVSPYYFEGGGSVIDWMELCKSRCCGC